MSRSTADGRLRRVLRVAKRERVRAHLARAEARLRARTGDDSARERHLDRLAAYRRRGEFPTNGTADRTPLFRDRSGTRCAMGALAAADGRDDVVEAVAREENTVDLAADGVPPALAAWLDGVPLSEREAAFVQPAYEPRPDCLGPLTCRQLWVSLLTVGTLGYLWVEWLLWLAVGEALPGRVLPRAGTFLAGSAVAFAVLSFLLFAVWSALFVPP